MINSSPLFQAAMRYSRVMFTELDIVLGGTVLENNVPVVSGTVTTDRSSNTRYTASAELAQYAWDTLPLDVYGTRVRIRRGIESIGSRESVQVGEYQLYDFKRSRRGSIPLTLKGLENLVIEDQFITPRTPPYGASTVDTIKALITESVPDAVFVVLCSTDRKITATGAWEKERWSAITKLADSIHVEVYCGHDGRWYIVDAPDLTRLVPVFYDTIGADGVLIEQSYTRSREKIYNAWSVSGQSSDPNVPAVWAWARDTDPASKTFYGGAFGKVTGYYSSQFFNTNAQCQAYADRLLAQSLAANWKMSLSSSPIPTLEAGDAVGTSAGLGVAGGTFLLQQTTLPLGSGTWNAEVLSDDFLAPQEEGQS